MKLARQVDAAAATLGFTKDYPVFEFDCQAMLAKACWTNDDVIAEVCYVARSAMAAVKKAKKRPTSSSKLTLRDLKLLTTLRRRGWKVSRVSRPRKLLPPAVSARYPRVPAGVLRLLSALEACCSPKETVWFLTAKDYARTGDAGFRWNEFEIMSLESADGDPELEAEIRSFWDGHFPVMLAVHSDYDYLAVRLSDGAVVHGYAPEWESPGEVAASFAALLIALEAEADAERDDGPFHIFVGSAS